MGLLQKEFLCFHRIQESLGNKDIWMYVIMRKVYERLILVPEKLGSIFMDLLSKLEE